MTKYLEFIVKGRVGVYSISESGQQKYVADSHGFTFLGDMEYALNKEPMFFAQCHTKVISLCLPLEENRSRLDQDIKFLQFVVHSLAKKVNSFSSQDIFLNTVEEKILDYSKNNEIKNIGLLANNLHCSRRQLQRTLSQLCKDGILRKKQKGVYCLIGGRFDV
jgi:CRP/FNR family transcriptional regulator, putaive post-exponential-phase nitrogen-starvation regulator